MKSTFVQAACVVGCGISVIAATIGCSPGTAPSTGAKALSLPASIAGQNATGASVALPSAASSSMQRRLDIIGWRKQLDEQPETKAEVVAALRPCLDDSDLDCRLLAADVMVQTGEYLNECQEILLKGLASERRYVASGRALNQIGASAMPAVLNALNSDDVRVRHGATFSIGMTWSLDQLDDRVRALTQLVRDDPEIKVRRQAAVALSTLLSNRWARTFSDSYRQELVSPELRPPAYQALTEALSDPSPEVRARVAISISQLDYKLHQAIPALVALMDDAESVKVRAVIALGAVISQDFIYHRIRYQPGEPFSKNEPDPDLKRQAVDALIAALDGETPKVQADAARAMYYAGRQASEAGPALESMLAAVDKQTRFWSALALSRVSPESNAAVPVLIEILSEKQSGLKTRAKTALAALSTSASATEE